MDITIQPGCLWGTVAAVPSKSQAHRLMICAALADAPTELVCPATNRDIEATVECLNALGATITRHSGGYAVSPIRSVPERAELNCRESGSTLRFLLPIAGALGVDATFRMEGRLPQRPLSPLWEEMERMGCTLSRPAADAVRCQGQLRSGEYVIDAGVSSQFVSGLLFALALLPQRCKLNLTGTIESRPYIDMTRRALAFFRVGTDDFRFSGGQRFHSPGILPVEGDWSNGAFFMAANYLGSDINVTGLSPCSAQGDRAAAKILPLLVDYAQVDAADIPDLVPILAVVAGARKGGEFTHIHRLRLKESDRVETVCSMLRALGGQAEANEDTLTVFGTGYRGGTVDAAGDHRIAMAAAIAATVCREPVTILGAQCVGKSYPDFWEDYRRLGGCYEQHIR